ncbi:hypothetical protein GCM10012275_43700 [Longimycelium tulufanense]|uniref:Excreted virulence factor EspC (Type VII ESX diderm) n=1 Tax=Longimycelium tulufanense TaxID=907463 RepID=A0A8J3CB59_9PSEU|nr:hypothetical protein [Longimycelium tulufanense]GGM68456.1 hypothetical protein GCM10012275_43700 [Longimycelium tulufanense]
MAPPGKDSITVATNALRAESRVWDEQAGTMSTVAQKAEGLRLNRVEAGLFQVVFSAYEETLNAIVDRSREGHQRMTEVATTLVQVANTYDQEEQHNEHRLRNLY